MYCLRVVADLFSTGLYQSASFTFHLLKKLVFALSVFIIFAACSVFWV